MQRKRYGRLFAGSVGLLGLVAGACVCGDTNVVFIDPGAKDASYFPVGPDQTSSNPDLDECKGDCDCPSDKACVLMGEEIRAWVCVTGGNSCSRPCNPPCPETRKCDNGLCVPKRCPTDMSCAADQVCDQGLCRKALCPKDITCPSGYVCDFTGVCKPGGGGADAGSGGSDAGSGGGDGGVGVPDGGPSRTCSTSVAVGGAPWNTTYHMDIHEFAQKVQRIGTFLDLLQKLLNGQGSCSSLSTPEGVFLCILSVIFGNNLNAPPWVNQLITVLSDVFKFGNKPVIAVGDMTLTEGANCSLSATETWREMWVEYGGQTLNLMNNPVLGSNGNVTVTVNPFGGYRDTGTVYLGPRDIDMDVNKFIVALINVAINATTGGQAKDVGGLLQLLLCKRISDPFWRYLCDKAASTLANNFKITSSFGGVHIDDQDAPIIDDDGNRVAEKLARKSPMGLLTGSMSNGIVSGKLGQPASGWYGVR